jgi:hypothetical protein
LRTTDDPISDYASQNSVDFSEDIRLSPARTTPHLTHSRVENAKEEAEAGSGSPVPKSSDRSVDFDSDLSGLLSDGDYVPSSGVTRRPRGPVHLFIADTPPSRPSGGVARKEETPPGIRVDHANAGPQDKPSDLLDSKPELR